MVKIRTALLAGLAMLMGCATQQQPILTPVEVEVPIATPVYCQGSKLDKPALPIAALHADSAPDDTIRAYAASVAVLKGAVQQRDLLIVGCSDPSADPAPVTESANPAVESAK